MKFLNKIENDTFDVFEGHKHDGKDSPLLRGIDEQVMVEKVNYSRIKTIRNLPDYIYGLKYINGMYLLAKNTKLYISTDLVKFTEVFQCTNNAEIADMLYANGRYVFRTTDEKIVYSVDLITFHEVAINSVNDLYDLTYAFGKYIVTGRKCAYYSTNLVNWTQATVPTVTSTLDLSNLVLVNDRLIACCDNTMGYYYSTKDGVTWKLHTVTNSAIFGSMTYGNGFYISGYGKTKVCITTDIDSTNWTEVTTNFIGQIEQIDFIDNTFIATGYDGAIYTSEDNGKTWTRRGTNLTTDPISIAGIVNGEVLLYSRSYNGGAHSSIYITSSKGMTIYEYVRELEKRLNYDTGWIPLKLEGTIVPYSTGYDLKVRKVGSQVFLKGVLKGITATGTFISVIPEGFRPPKDHAFTMPGTAKRHNRFSIKASTGKLMFEYTSSDAQNFSDTNWYPIQTTYLVD